MNESGSAWEYNAPQFVDFNSPRALDLNDQADAWFDLQTNPTTHDEDFFSIPNTQTPEVKKFELSDEITEGDKSVYYDTDPTEEDHGEETEDGDGEETEEMLTPPKKRMRRATRDSTTSVSSMVSMTSTTSAPAGTRSNLVTSWGANAKKTYPSAGGLRRSRRKSLQESRVKMHPPVTAVKRQTPKRPTAKTTEELELEKIEALRKRAQQAMKQSQKSMALAQSGTRKRTHQEVQPATRPHEFHFQTDQRIKNHNMKTRQDETLKPEDFAKCLRSNKSLSRNRKQQPSGPTVPKPFHLTNTHVKSKKLEPGYKFHSDAEKMIRFQKDTPERFRSRPRNDPGQPQLEKHQPKLTMPHTPHLVSRNRKRPITVVSAAEMEEQELEEIKKFKFHAQPVNAKIFEKEHGIPKVEAKGTTKPVEFDLRTLKRPLVDRNAPEEEEKYEFKAQPVPRNILDGAVGIKKPQKAPLTVPESPAFALKNRVRSVIHLDTTDSDEVDRIVRANPVPHLGVAFQPKIDHKATVPEPFSFDERDQKKMKEKEEKIMKVIEDETKPHEFHAQPVPRYDALHEQIPKTKVKPITVPEPFNLEGYSRSQQKQEEMERMKEEEIRELREGAQFKARPATVVTKDPFIPKRTDKPLTEISEFELNTERRAVERDMYEERKHEKDTMLEQMNMERMRRHEEQEKQELRDMRDAMVHKAQPIKHYRPVSIHPSEKNLTEPQSPAFSDRFKK